MKEWDFKIGTEPDFFDPSKSYECIGYRPVTETEGLDFKIDPFIVSRTNKLISGKYIDWAPGTKKYDDFWNEEYKRCKEGYTVGDYTLTGDNYFFINYYRLPNAIPNPNNPKRVARYNDFPKFVAKQYEWFHYVALAEYLGKDCLALKPRGIGWSEIAASLGVCIYTVHEQQLLLYTAFAQDYVDNTLAKCWTQLTYLNTETQGGFAHARSVIDSSNRKKASYKTVTGDEKGWMSEIEGIVSDRPGKLRGRRCRRLFFEESGSDKTLKSKYIQSEALISTNGIRFGTRFAWGCVCAGTKIWTNSGKLINIEDLQYSDGLLGFNGKNVATQRINYLKPPQKKLCYKISTQEGFTIECSHDHPLLIHVNNDEKIVNDKTYKRAIYQEASIINSGDKILLPSEVSVFGKRKVGDSLISLQQLNTQSLPIDIHEYDKQSVAKILALYFDNSGTVHYRKSENIVEVVLKTTTYDLLEQIKYELLKFGIHCTISQDIRNDNSLEESRGLVYQLYIKNQSDVKRFKENILISHKTNIDNLNKITNVSDDLMDVYFEINPLNNKEGYFNRNSEKEDNILTDLRYQTVKSVECIGEQNVYNLNCNDNHNYLSNGFITRQTGGDHGEPLKALSEMFYNPETYNVLPYYNNYNDKLEWVYTGFFIPAYQIHFVYCDQRGVTNSYYAKEDFDKLREQKKDDPKAYIEIRSETCYTPEEALVREGENQFDQVRLINQLSNIKVFKDCPKPECGFLERFGNSDPALNNMLTWVPNKSGKILILEHPERNPDGTYIPNLYCAGIDSIDYAKEDSSGQTDVSEFCLVVKKRMYGLQEPKYVCIYKERPTRMNDAYDNAIKILEYYNAKALLEQSRITITNYFRDRKKVDKLLVKSPSTLKANLNVKSNVYGVYPSPAVISHYINLICNYVLDYSHNIWFEEILTQLIKYSNENKRKFDIVAAIGMCELNDENMKATIAATNKELKNTWDKQDYGFHINKTTGQREYGWGDRRSWDMTENVSWDDVQSSI